MKIIYIIILCTILIYPSLESAFTIPASSYYSPTRTISSLEIRHAPCSIFIEQDPTDLTTKKGFEAITEEFYNSLNLSIGPIIVSTPILYNFIYRKEHINDPNHPENKQIIDVNLHKRDWKMFNVPDSTFVLLVPQQFLLQYATNTGLNINTLEDKTNLLDTFDNFAKWLLDEKLNQPHFSVDALKSIFKQYTDNNHTPIWDIIVSGHGEYQTMIVNLSPAEIQQLIHFFNTHVKTGIMYISSCYAGGENLQTLSFKNTIDNQQLLMSINYIIIVGSITDAPVYSILKSTSLQHDFFDQAAQLQGTGTSLDAILKMLYEAREALGQSMHGSSAIPQVWLPQGFGFTTLNIDKKIEILNTVQLRIHEENKTDLTLRNKAALLVYPSKIPIAINVHSSSASGWDVDHIRTEDLWEYVPTVYELSRITPLGVITNIPATKDLDDANALTQVRSKHLFPEFISMQHGSTTHHFSSINVHKGHTDGIITFIREAFLDINGRITEKRFLIDRLHGFNDLLVLLELARVKDNSATPHPLESLLLPYMNTDITLSNVLIITKGNLVMINDQWENTWNIDISFEIDNTAWQLTLDNQLVKADQRLWDFKPINFNQHNANYTITQHTIRSEQSTPQDLGNYMILWDLILYPNYIQDIISLDLLSNQSAIYSLLTKIFNAIQQSPDALANVVNDIKEHTWSIPITFKRVDPQLHSDTINKNQPYIQKLNEELATKTALTTTYDAFMQSLQDYYQFNKKLFEEYKKELIALHPNKQKELTKLKPLFHDDIKKNSIKSFFRHYMNLKTPQTSPFIVINKNDNILLLDVSSSPKTFILLFLFELAKNMNQHIDKPYTILLSKLSGYNDLLPFLEAISILTGDPISPLAARLTQYSDQSITLEKIMVETTLLPSNTLNYSLSFIFEDKAWKLSIQVSLHDDAFYNWNIEEINKVDLEERFNTLEKELINKQKTITQTLRDKAKKIAEETMKHTQSSSTP